MLKNTSETYGSVAKFLHWVIFLLIATLLAVGFIMSDMENSPDKLFVYGIHKSTGIIVLLLALIRLGWKFANVSPVLPSNMRDIEKLAARAGHALLYLLMVAMPLSGWLMSSAAGYSVSVFGLFTLPDLVAPDKELKHLMGDAHEILALVIMAVVALHAAAALLHHFYHKNNVLRRMLPFGMALLLAFPAGAAVPEYTVIKEKSFLRFVARQNSAPVSGEFTDFTASIHFDKDKPEESKITAEVNVGSVKVGNDDVQQNIGLPAWLSTAAFPKATFTSTKVNRTPGTNDFFVNGELTLKGKTMPVSLNFSLQETGNVAVAKGFITLKRSDYNVGEGEWSRDDVVADAVRVDLRIVAEKK